MILKTEYTKALVTFSSVSSELSEALIKSKISFKLAKTFVMESSQRVNNNAKNLLSELGYFSSYKLNSF